MSETPKAASSFGSPAQASGAPPAEAPTIEALDPEVHAAIAVPSEPPKVDD
jgi:hypothetical protein